MSDTYKLDHNLRCNFKKQTSLWLLCYYYLHIIIKQDRPASSKIAVKLSNTVDSFKGYFFGTNEKKGIWELKLLENKKAYDFILCEGKSITLLYPPQLGTTLMGFIYLE